MSHENIERFLNALATDPELASAFQTSVSGLESVVQFACANGYDITEEEASEYMATQADIELSDEQLEAIAGGKGPSNSNTTMISTQMTGTTTPPPTTTEVVQIVTTVATAMGTQQS